MSQPSPGGGVIALAISRPVGVLVGVILVMMFGFLSVFDLPIQLTPDIEVPTLTVSTVWPGATPAEVEREILLEQEEALKSVTGLQRMISEAQNGQGTITLEFDVGTSIEEALVRTSNRLGQVPDYPDAAREPVLSTADSAGPPLAVIIFRATDGRPINPYRTWADQQIIPIFERIPGVAGVRFFGGRDTQLAVTFDPAALAARGLTVDTLTAAVQGELRDVSGGTLDLGKRRYVVRTEVAPAVAEQLESVVLAVDAQGNPVRLGDVATARMDLRKFERKVFSDGQESMALLFDREAGSNVLEVTQEILATTAEVNETLLAPRGMELVVVSDQTAYINGALALVRNNLLLGGALAVVVLLLFLRSVSASAVVATAIPVCVMGTVLGMSLLGRSVNVVSLAGMAFAVGMVVDNAIVVLENIDTWRKRGVPAAQAALEGTREVWGAIVASTLTTAAVFIPVIQWQDEVGELLRDVAVAITVAVFLSLVVSVLVIPSFSARLLSAEDPEEGGAESASFGARVRNGITDTVTRLVASTPRSIGAVVVALGGAVLLVVTLLPPMEYLPTGNRNFMFGIVVPPPGYSVEEMGEIGEYVQGRIVEHMGAEVDGVPAIGRTFFAALPGQGFMGASAEDPARIGEVVGFVRGVLREVPGIFGIATQASLFGRSIGGGRSVEVELSGSDIGALVSVGGQMMGAIAQALPDAQTRPIPSLDAGGPELRVLARREDAARLGLTPARVGAAVDAMIDGRIVGELGQPGEPQVDVVVQAAPEPASPGALMAAPIATPAGAVVPLSAVADLVETLSPTTIRRIERRRAITLQVSPPDDVAVEEAMQILREQIIAPMRADGRLPSDVRVTLAGVADKLTGAQLRMGQTLLLAVVISFLLMAALFEDFLAPLVILVTVPLAGAGGLVGLWLVDTFLGAQPLDMMTALGFIILIGVVVNNAILIVDGALARLREGDALPVSVAEAVRGRVRPIFMSSLTSLAGLTPLVLFPGSGSELYRGVGAIVLGGLALSTALTLFVVPALFALTWRLRGVR
ncbi:MAG: efflux RND transporter permease subunit [Alphaproteobacteria bacterium]|nr:efflux RND transporter permease subunit [Alphaproteobacteria bacterium]